MMLKISDFVSFLTFGLPADQMKSICEFSWRCIVAFHMAYACGLLASLGLPLTGFAQKAELNEVKAEVARIDKALVLQARLGIIREIREHTVILCSTTDPRAKDTIQRTIDRLREDYRTLTKTEHPEPRCT
jgi:hypothetical protein